MKTLLPLIAIFAAALFAPASAFAADDDELAPQEYMPLTFEFDNLAETVVFLIDWTESMTLPFGNGTRADYVISEVKKTASRFSKGVKVGVVLYNTSDKCKYSGTDISEMGTEKYLSEFYWWAYKGSLDNGTLNMTAAAFTFDGPYTQVMDPSELSAGEITDFISKRKPQGLSSMGAGIFAAMRVKGVKTVLMVCDGPPEVLEDGRQWTLPENASELSEWKESPYRPQGRIPKHGIDGHVRKIAESKIGGAEVFKNLNFHAGYFEMPEWGVKLLDDLAKMNGGSAKKIGQ